MTEERRRLIFKVSDGDRRLLTLCHTFCGFYRANQMFEWLIRNNLTGERLMRFALDECGASYFNLAKFVLTKVKGEQKLQPVMAGIDHIARRL